MRSLYYVYILECSDKTLYTGYTNDLEERIKKHNTKDKGAKYTRGRQPVKIIYYEKFDSKTDALKREHKIKRLTRDEKLQLINH
jgi:putative endonuclease